MLQADCSKPVRCYFSAKRKMFKMKVPSIIKLNKNKKDDYLKGYFTSEKMNLYLKWVIYVEEMFNLELSRLREARKCIFMPMWMKKKHVDERQQVPECTCFAALGGHAYR